MNDRLIKVLSIALAVLFHALVLYLGNRHYAAVLTNPDRANAAAQALAGAKQKPFRFVYVKDDRATKEPPLDPSRRSDLQRRGASPDGGKGTSPDPFSLGESNVRTPGSDRPGTHSLPPSPPPSPPPAPKGGRGAQVRAPAGPSEGRGREARELSKPETDLPGKLTLPRPDEVPGTSKKGTSGATPDLPQQPPSGQGVRSPMQQMYVGALQGGYNNPIASRLNSGTVSFDTSAWDLGPYARQVQERVQSNWRIPEAQEVLRQKGWVAIHFEVHADGRVTGLKVVRPSGVPSYDQAALNALRTSDPLPPLPPEVGVPMITGTFRFFYNLPITDDPE